MIYPRATHFKVSLPTTTTPVRKTTYKSSWKAIDLQLQWHSGGPILVLLHPSTAADAWRVSCQTEQGRQPQYCLLGRPCKHLYISISNLSEERTNRHCAIIAARMRDSEPRCRLCLHMQGSLDKRTPINPICCHLRVLPSWKFRASTPGRLQQQARAMPTLLFLVPP
jgi:hypothetical protein